MDMDIIQRKTKRNSWLQVNYTAWLLMVSEFGAKSEDRGVLHGQHNKSL
jgi:hypothetical protein